MKPYSISSFVQVLAMSDHSFAKIKAPKVGFLQPLAPSALAYDSFTLIIYEKKPPRKAALFKILLLFQLAHTALNGFFLPLRDSGLHHVF